MRMLMRVCIDVCMKTPYPVVTYHPMDIAVFVQPFKYPIERDTIQSMLTLETPFNLMMADRMFFPQKHGKDLHPARGHSVPTVSNRLFRLFVQVDKHRNYCNLVAFIIAQERKDEDKFCKPNRSEMPAIAIARGSNLATH
jgi:hypothetical protein